MKKKKQKITNADFFEFAYLWFRLQNLNMPNHQKKMSKWLYDLWLKKDDRKALLMSFRNSGKSTIVGLFCSWCLYMNNSERILVLAADYDLAKKMVRNVKRIIEYHPLTKHLKPKKAEQWSGDQFTINRNVELRDPSMLAKGLGSNITGLRADIVICDDVEVPKNCDSMEKRIDMRDKLSELDYIITPSGLQLYIGTPHSFYTIYKTKKDEDNPENVPFLLGFNKLEIPILDKLGKSIWPERFSETKIASIRMRSGENKFLSQMMLKSVNIKDCVLSPDDMVRYNEDIELIHSNSQQILKIGAIKMLSATCWWDPSFAKGSSSDNSVVACVFSDREGRFWLHDIEYINIDENVEDTATGQCEKVADFIIRNFIPAISIETNGIGKFLPGILRQVLKKRKVRVSVKEAYSHINKEKRILEAFEVVLANKSLFVHEKIWKTGFIEEMREWSPSSKNKDDALDAVAGCLLVQPERISTLCSDASFNDYKWQGDNKQFRAKTIFDI